MLVSIPEVCERLLFILVKLFYKTQKVTQLALASPTKPKHFHFWARNPVIRSI